MIGDELREDEQKLVGQVEMRRDGQGWDEMGTG